MRLLPRFIEKVPDRPDTGCWLWQGTVGANGYGYLADRGNGQRKDYLAHRLAHLLYLGPTPDGMEVEHLCEVKRCVRWEVDPEMGTPHLRLATHAENMQTSAHRIGWGEFQRRKTHCPQGHPYDEENTYVAPGSGKRYCRTCKDGRR